eukprot:4884035-Prymnesium_polylepis.1
MRDQPSAHADMSPKPGRAHAALWRGASTAEKGLCRRRCGRRCAFLLLLESKKENFSGFLHTGLLSGQICPENTK